MWEQTSLPRHVRGGLVSLCNTGPLGISRQIICIHDVNTRVCPESYSRSFRLLYRILPPLLARRAAFVTTVSHYSAAELIRFGIATQEKTRVIPNGSDHAAHWKPFHSDKTRAASGLNTIVLLGSQARHKNIGLVLGLATELGREGLRIAVVGMSDARVFQSTSGPTVSGASRNVLWLGRLSDDEIAALLRDSLCLAFPSLVEGFGLPAVEAMTWGCPVISSDRASLPEICGDAAILVPADDPTRWREAILRLANDAALRETLIVKGRQRAEAYQWRASAEAYLQTMHDADTASGIS
jgi:glycosyltransferase involved in cell wall biosynthesis